MTTITATPRLALLEQARSIDDVIDNLDRIIAWSIDTGSTIGYFAVLYKRSTLAIREAIRLRLFENPERMEEFDVVFAQRYFDALNAYFHPADAGELLGHLVQVASAIAELDGPQLAAKLPTLHPGLAAGLHRRRGELQS